MQISGIFDTFDSEKMETVTSYENNVQFFCNFACVDLFIDDCIVLRVCVRVCLLCM